MSNFVFPIEKVPYGCRLALYGLGRVGQEFVRFIRDTRYCEIVFIADTDVTKRNDLDGNQVIGPSELALRSNEFDYVLLCLANEAIRNDVVQKMISLNVPESQIISCKIERVQKTKGLQIISDDDDGGDSLKMAVYIPGVGFGDYFLTMAPLKAMKKTANIAVDMFISSAAAIEFLSKSPYVDRVMHADLFSEDNDYDIVLEGGSFFLASKLKMAKIRRISHTLSEYFHDMLWHYENILKADEIAANCKLLDYCRILNKQRVEQANFSGILPFDRYSQLYVEFEEEAINFLENLNALPGSFITVCNTVNSHSPKSTKIWPLEYYSELCGLIKKRYPQILIFRIGDPIDSGTIDHIDRDLRGLTSIDELCVLLKFSRIHIGSECGLIHLSHFLNGRSLCLYGSTDIDIYGYKENLNIRSLEPVRCVRGCEAINLNWYRNGFCLLDKDSDYALCMKNLTAAFVFEKLSSFLSEQKSYVLKNYKDNLTFVNQASVAVIKGAQIFHTRKLIDNICNAANVCTFYPAQVLCDSLEYGDLLNIPAAASEFDIVVISSALVLCEYAEAEVCRVLKPGGFVIFVNSDGEIAKIKSKIFNED